MLGIRDPGFTPVEVLKRKHVLRLEFRKFGGEVRPHQRVDQLGRLRGDETKERKGSMKASNTSDQDSPNTELTADFRGDDGLGANTGERTFNSVQGK